MTNYQSIRVGHATIMSLVFVLLAPSASLTLYLPYTKKVPHIHAPLQVLNVLLLVVGLTLGITLARPLALTTGYHQITGYTVVAILFTVQPTLGLLQHLYSLKTGTRSILGVAHQWLGRTVIILGVINGGLGMSESRPIPIWFPTYAPILYSVAAGVMLLIYLTVVVGSAMRKRAVKPRGENDGVGHEKARDAPA